jgi:hypothetical protein
VGRGNAARISSITSQRGHPAVGQEESVILSVKIVQQHLLVISEQENAAKWKPQKEIHHLAHLRPAIDVIADEDQFVIKLEFDLLQQPLKRLEAPMDVPDHMD